MSSKAKEFQNKLENLARKLLSEMQGGKKLKDLKVIEFDEYARLKLQFVSAFDEMAVEEIQRLDILWRHLDQVLNSTFHFKVQ